MTDHDDIAGGFDDRDAQLAGLSAPPLPATSRYTGVGTAIHRTATGQPVVYLRRRFVPRADRFEILQEHRVEDGDRLDRLTARYLGDPEQFWRLCDANEATHPEELTETIGSIVGIPLPEGFRGVRNG